MPIYEYKCPKCSIKFQRRCSFSETNAAVDCPDCKAPAKKQLSTFAALSKGASGEVAPIAGAGAGCGCGPSCPATSCGTCQH